MTQIQRGHGGCLNNTALISRAAALALLCLALAAAGCSSKRTGSETGQVGQGTLGTETNANGSSLTQFQKGLTGEQGPLHDIHFGFNEYSIEPQDASIMRANGQWLESHPQTHVQIEGHCDERGSEEYNIALGARRAQAGKDYLETLGISPERISTISYGKELPLCTEHNEDCWYQNRRDHFVVSGQ